MAKFCIICGNQLNDNAMFCPKCGTKFEVQSSPQQKTQSAPQINEPVQQSGALKKKKSPAKAIIAIVLVIAVLVGGFAFWKFDPLSLFGKDEKTSASESKDGDIEEKEDKDDGNDNDGKDKTSDNVDTATVLSVGDVGSCVTFGQYEQDGDKSNGKEDIEWLVLAKENGKALLISKFALDKHSYNINQIEITWEKCSLRKWLNDSFLNEAFSSSDQLNIIETTVTADKNSEYDTEPGNDTVDKIFLLSESEANKYFTSDAERVCKPTGYALSEGIKLSIYGDNKENCYWWLRTPGSYGDSAIQVCYDGAIYEYGSGVIISSLGVRPAMWVVA